MNYILFLIFIGAVGTLFFGSAYIAHKKVNRLTIGWWAGVAFSIFLFAIAQSSFQSLPQQLVEVTSGCSEKRKEYQTDWNTFVDETTKIDVPSILVGILLAFLAFEIFYWIKVIPERLLAFILLCLSFTSLSLLLYIFLIRKLSYIFFSTILGAVGGSFVHATFFSRQRLPPQRRIQSSKKKRLPLETTAKTVVAKSVRRCPKCELIYLDQDIIYCLEDGSKLVSAQFDSQSEA